MFYYWLDESNLPLGNYWICIHSEESAKRNIKEYVNKHRSNDSIILSFGQSKNSNSENFIEILEWLEKEDLVDETFYFHIHTKDTFFCIKMKEIISRNH